MTSTADELDTIDDIALLVSADRPLPSKAPCLPIGVDTLARLVWGISSPLLHRRLTDGDDITVDRHMALRLSPSSRHTITTITPSTIEECGGNTNFTPKWRHRLEHLPR
jgi:hypothetical protein